MTIFCITGFSKASTELTESVLLAGGMATHLPLERDPTLNLVRWHERAIGAQQQTSSSASEVVDKSSQPSRIWLQLAIDLMVANMNSVHWGWAHTGAVPWLDFWSQLEPEIRFVLVCEDRLSLVCRLLEEGQTPESTARHLALWAQNHQEMLRFHLRNPAKSLLVWAAEVQTQPKQLIASIEHHWQTRLDASRVTPQASEQPTSLLQHIALRILSEHPHTAPLDFELQALIGSPPSSPASGDIKTADLIELYGQLKERDTLQIKLHLLQEELDKYLLMNQEAQEKNKDETAAKQNALNQLAAEQTISLALKKEKDALSAAHQEALAKHKDLQEESELLLAQLRQVQEKLETYFLLNQEAQEKIKAETTAKQDALNQLATEQKNSASLKKHKDELNAAQQQALTKHKNLQMESDLVSAQLQQVKKEVEKLSLSRHEAQEKINAEITAKQDALNQLVTEQKNSAALKKQKDELNVAQQDVLAKHKNLQMESDLVSAQLQQEKEKIKKISLLNQEVQEKIKIETAIKYDALNKLATEQKTIANLKKQKDEFIAAHQKALTKNKNLQEESDLLLAQLHQVEEELEKHYLQNKDRQIEVQALQDRWLRAVQNHPELLDFEDLEILSESETELTAHWRINQLNLGGVMKGPFEFKTLIENGVAGLMFSKDSKGLSPLHRWPLIAAKDNQLTIIPVKGHGDPQKRSATILQLGATDWHLVQLLTDKLIKSVGAAPMAKPLGHAQALLEALKAQRQILQKVPALLRFDDIQLLGQQNNKIKSVIGLRLIHADLQGLKANPFEFQLQLNLNTDSAMGSAHLIFDDKTSGNPFENWTQNVKSSAGHAVMALQLSPKGWDPLVWHALSPLDQQWMHNTVRLLPFMLSTLQSQGLKLEKNWSTWAEAAAELINWSKLSVGLPETTVIAMDATSSELQPPDAAPVPPLTLRKSRSAKAMPAKPRVRAKVATESLQKPNSAKTNSGKPTIKAKVATKVPARVADKSKQVKAKPAVSAKVATKTKRRA